MTALDRSQLTLQSAVALGAERTAEFRPHIVTVGGLPLSVVDRAQAAEILLAEAAARKSAGVRPWLSTSANGQVLSLCASNPEFRRLVLEFDEIHADGMPLVFASRLLCAAPLPERVATTDLFHDAAELAQRQGKSFFLLGADEETIARAAAEVGRLYPNLRLLGAHHGYLDDDLAPRLVSQIADLRPDVLWLGMGFPREQAFTIRHAQALRGVGAVKTSGGLFDFLSKRRSRAPTAMQRLGLEWLYRTWLEPRRLGWRYLVTNPHAAWLLGTRTRRDPL